MDTKFTKFLALACCGVICLLWGVYHLATIPEFYYEWGSTRYVRNDSHTSAWFFVLLGGAQMGVAVYLYRRTRLLEIECLDLILDKADSMRCHLIQAGKGVINSGTRYMGEDGEIHIRWDKPRRRSTWKIDKTLTAEDIRRYME